MLKFFIKLFISESKRSRDLIDPEKSRLTAILYGGSKYTVGFRHWPTWAKVLTGIVFALAIIASIAAIANVVGLTVFGVGILSVLLAPLVVKVAVATASLFVMALSIFFAHHMTTPAIKAAAVNYLESEIFKADIGIPAENAQPNPLAKIVQPASPADTDALTNRLLSQEALMPVPAPAPSAAGQATQFENNALNSTNKAIRAPTLSGYTNDLLRNETPPPSQPNMFGRAWATIFGGEKKEDPRQLIPEPLSGPVYGGE